MTASRVDVPAVIVFAVSSVVLAWLVALPLWLRGQGLTDILLGPTAAAMMFTPALATVLALLVQRPTRGRRGARAVLRELGMWPLRPARRTVGVAVVMIFAMPLILIVGIGIMALTGMVELDLVDFSGFAQALQTGTPAGIELPPVQLLVALQLASIPLAAVINAPFAFGEEVGWRGWLLPALRPLGTWPALLISGAFWGLWHAPLILLGYNFAEPDLLGVGLMVAACTLFGVLLGWSRLRTASVWPAVFAHGAFNASAGIGVLLVAADSPVPSAAIAGPLGIVTWVVFALAIGVLLVSGQFRGDRLQAELRPDPVRPAPAPVSW